MTLVKFVRVVHCMYVFLSPRADSTGLDGHPRYVESQMQSSVVCLEKDEELT